jgi:hypothetical protein
VTEIVDPDVFEIIRTAEALIADLRLRVERTRELRVGQDSGVL